MPTIHSVYLNLAPPSTSKHYLGRPVLYAIGFEISIDSHLEMCARLGVKFDLPTDAPPPIISRMTHAISASLTTDVIQICEDYLSQWAKRPLTIIPLDDIIVADVEHGICVPRLYVCHVVRKLGRINSMDNVRAADLDGGPGADRVRKLLGCESVPMQEYIFRT